jgi:hypothetical protein
MRTIIRGERGGVRVLVGFVIIAVIFGLAFYEFWVKDQRSPQEVTDAPAKTLMDSFSDKVKDSQSKQLNRIPEELRSSEENQRQETK